MNINMITEKINRRKRRKEKERRNHILRMEYDPKAIRARARHQKEQAEEWLRRVEKSRAMKPNPKHQNFLDKIINKGKQIWKTCSQSLSRIISRHSGSGSAFGS